MVRSLSVQFSPTALSIRRNRFNELYKGELTLGHFGAAPKLLNKALWSARRLGCSAHIETLYSGGTALYPVYVKRIRGPVYLEPVFGYPITDGGFLIEEAMDPHYVEPKETWRNGLPSMLNFEQTIRRPELIDRHKSVVSLRHFWEWNYFHFHLDVLGKLKLLSNFSFPKDTAYALGLYVRQMSFASDILSKGRLASKSFVVPDVDNRRIVLADELIYCRIDPRFYRNRIECLVDQMDLPPVSQGSCDKVFLTRNPPASSRILNFSELRPLIEARGFRIVDSAQLTVDEQIKTFAQVRYLAAVHGAGLINMIYRRAGLLSVLEIHASNYVTDDFRDISQEFNYKYQRLPCEPVGPEKAQGSGMHVNAGDLEMALDQLVQG
jgi:hypothetical protein